MKVADIEVALVDHCGSDLSVVNAARVSFAKESSWATTWAGDRDGLVEKDEKLIRYLAEHKHFSPFNHCFISVRVKAPIFVARQLVKHKFMPWNEVSRRYVDDEPEFYFPEYWRGKAANVKQGSSGDVIRMDHVFGWGGRKLDPHTVVAKSLESYNELIASRVCPEQARMVLPQNTMTEWIWSGTLGAFCDMLRLRQDPHTQKETRTVAQKIMDIVEPLFPVSVKELLSV